MINQDIQSGEPPSTNSMLNKHYQ